MNDTETIPINIVGLVIRTAAKHQKDIISALENIAGTEIHHAEAGKCVVTIEQTTAEIRLADVITDINNLPGVIATSIAYHHFDGDLANQEQSL